MTTFTGFPVAALDFYDDLEVDNTKSFWEAHKSIYAEAIQGPMKALCGALEPEFGAAKIFRPYRDVRFAADKTPYKTNQGAFVGVGEATGWYVDISARGVRVGGGFYHAPTARLAAYRAAVAHDRFGPELERILGALRADGYDVGGEQLKTAPRGFDRDHPRIDLLRHKSVVVGRMLGFEPVIHTAELLDEVREHWRALAPLVEWSRVHLAT